MLGDFVEAANDGPRHGKTPSVHLEILTLLPVGHLRLEPCDLGLLDGQQIVDECGAELLPEERALAQRRDSLPKASRQRLGLGIVGRVGRGPGSRRRAMPSRPAWICEAM